MAATCWAPVRGKAIRLTKVTGCGAPVLCPDGTPLHVVSDGVVSVQIEPEIDNGTDITQANFNGDSCVDIPACPHIRWMNLTLEFCKIDPELFSLWTSVPIVRNPDGVATGFRVRKNVSCEEGVALEIWTGSAGGNRCAPNNPATVYGYLLFPWINSGILGSYTVQNGTINFTVTGKAIDGGAWGVGPYNIYQNAAGVGRPLTDPIIEGDLHHVDVTTMPPPAPTCGTNCEVNQDPPRGTITAQASDPSGRSVNLSYDNSPNGAVTIDWGDGSPIQNGSTETGLLSHVFPGPGTYTVRVRDANFPTAFVDRTYVVPATPPPLTASLTPPNFADPSSVNVTFDNSGQGTVTIDWGDGTTDTVSAGSTGVVPHTYAAPGTYSITVADSNDPSRIVGPLNYVAPAALTASTAAAASDASGMTVALTYNNFGAGPVDIDWGDGSAIETVDSVTPVNHLYPTAATTFTIVVTDTQAATRTDTTSYTTP